MLLRCDTIFIVDGANKIYFIYLFTCRIVNLINYPTGGGVWKLTTNLKFQQYSQILRVARQVHQKS